MDLPHNVFGCLSLQPSGTVSASTADNRRGCGVFFRMFQSFFKAFSGLGMGAALPWLKWDLGIERALVTQM